MKAIKPKLISIVGARPQFIKLAPMHRALSKKFDHTVIHTGQHHDINMSDIFFEQLNIPTADFDLGIAGGTHGKMTGRMLMKIEQVLLEQKPAMVIVYGDTNSTLAGTLAAVKLSIPVAHVEAGLRSHVKDMPEEINRVLTDRVADILFCPTQLSINSLKHENVPGQIVHSGDVMYELLNDSRSVIKANSTILNKFGLKKNSFYLVTAHRAANVDKPERLKCLVEILRELNFPTLFPIHPRTKKRLQQQELFEQVCAIENLQLCEPLGYLDLLAAAMNARAVLTDSGGLQKEAVFLGTKTLTLRDETEWEETLEWGNTLVGLDNDRVQNALADNSEIQKIDHRINGKKPSVIISTEIVRYLK